MKRRNIKLEAYTRRENIKIFNIEENEGENGNTESLVRNVFREKMKIPKEDEEYIRFERIHRITPRRSSSKPRPIIVKFSHYQDKESVWSFVKNLKGTNIGIANDFPKEIEEIQSKLYPVLKKAKKAKQAAFFKVNRLIINGQVYRGKETEDLEHYGAIMWMTVFQGRVQRKARHGINVNSVDSVDVEGRELGINLNMIFHVVVSVYRLVTIWNSPQFPDEFRNDQLQGFYKLSDLGDRHQLAW